MIYMKHMTDYSDTCSLVSLEKTVPGFVVYNSASAKEF
jgi:hypothetical protein